MKRCSKDKNLKPINSFLLHIRSQRMSLKKENLIQNKKTKKPTQSTTPWDVRKCSLHQPETRSVQQWEIQSRNQSWVWNLTIITTTSTSTGKQNQCTMKWYGWARPQKNLHTQKNTKNIHKQQQHIFSPYNTYAFSDHKHARNEQ